MQKTIEELVQMYESGKLRTEQSTQRNFIYNDIKTLTEDGEITKAGAVIRSILQENITLPALYFWNVQDDVENVHYEEDEFNIHDGKQRFLSIYNFVAGNVVTRINGQELSFNMLSDELKNKLFDYKIDIVVRRGTLAEEERSFFLLNTTGEPLTTYEGLRGAYHGRFIYEFENYLTNKAKQLDSIKPIGRGQQALSFLYTCLDVINEDKKRQTRLAEDRLTIERNREFDSEAFKLDEKIDLYNDLYNAGFSNKEGQHTPEKICRVADFVIKHNYDKNKVYLYYKKGFANPNDIGSWNKETNETAIRALANGIECDYTRNFSKAIKSELYRKSQKCACCGKSYDYDKLEIDHIKPWSQGGRTNINNAQLLCKTCNTSKGAK